MKADASEPGSIARIVTFALQSPEFLFHSSPYIRGQIEVRQKKPARLDLTVGLRL
jgi:hypothetical protein